MRLSIFKLCVGLALIGLIPSTGFTAEKSYLCAINEVYGRDLHDRDQARVGRRIDCQFWLGRSPTYRDKRWRCYSIAYQLSCSPLWLKAGAGSPEFWPPV